MAAAVADFEREALRLAREVLPALAKEEERTDGLRTDGLWKSAKEALSFLRKRLTNLAGKSGPAGRVRASSATAGKRTAAHVKRELERIRIPSPKMEPELDWLIDGWTKDNVARTKGLLEDQADRIVKVLRENEGARHETLAGLIEEAVGVTSSKAALIARCQVLSLNGKIVRYRMMKSGVDEFIWTTTGDHRVRPTHHKLDGKKFRWDDPPEVEPGRKLIPGEDYNCRCTAYPVLPELA